MPENFRYNLNLNDFTALLLLVLLQFIPIFATSPGMKKF